MCRTGDQHPESPAELKKLSETTLRGLWIKLVTESQDGEDIGDELTEPDLTDVRSALFGRSQSPSEKFRMTDEVLPTCAT